MGSLFARSVAILSSPQLLVTFIWLGVAVLTISLVVLMRTRWGQTEPLRKCVVLSLFAHLLLLAYATTVHVVHSHPRPGRGSGVVVTSLSDLDYTHQPQSGSSHIEPWEESHHGRAFPDVDEFTAPKADVPLPPALAPAAAVLADRNQPWAPLDVPTLDDDQPPEKDEAAHISEPAAAEPLAVQNEPQTAPTPEPAIGPPVEALAAAAASAKTEEASPAEPNSDPAIAEAAKPGAEKPLPLLAGETLTATEPAADTATAPAMDAAPAEPFEAIAGPAPAAGQGNATAGAGAAPPLAALPAATAGTMPSALHVTPEMYRQRLRSDRLGLVESQGGSARTEAAVNAALQWLVNHQHADGHWDAKLHGAGRETRTLGRDRQGAGANADTGLTGLALLAFLGSGHTQRGGEHTEAVQHGLDYLVSIQAADGNLANNAETYAFMYCHGMATLAISEAYAMTGDVRLERPLRRAIAYSVAAQNLATGGWRYKPSWQMSPTELGDTSHLGWQLMALKSADLARVSMPEKTRQAMVRFLNNVSQGTHGGLAAYRPGERATRTMTAEALVCRQFLNLSVGANGNEAGSFLLEELPGASPANFYYWYYGTLAMYQLQGEHWKRWNDALSTTLVESQLHEGDLAGSWTPDDVWGGYGGRVFSTALGALCLEVYYRYLPLYNVTAGRPSGVSR